MDEYDKITAVDAEDMLDAGDFIVGFTETLRAFEKRTAGTAEETAAARCIRDKLHEETGAKTRLEAFRTYPLAGRGSCFFLGLWFALSLALYFISFAGDRLAGILLTALSLAVFLAGMFVFGSLFIGKSAFRGILTSKVSYNVVSERNATLVERGKERNVVIAASHDAPLGSFFGDFALLRKLSFIVAPVSALLFVFFCLLKMGVGTDTPAKITVLTIIPFLTSLAGIFILITHFSLSQRHARENNGVAAATALAAYAYFVENPEYLPDDVKLTFVCFGGENATHSGSEAFVKSHTELREAKVLCIGDITSGSFEAVERDALRKIEFSRDIVSKIKEAASEQKTLCPVAGSSGKHKLNSLHGYPSGSFAEQGIASATIIAKDYTVGGEALNRDDIERLFALTVGTLKKLMEEGREDERNV